MTKKCTILILFVSSICLGQSKNIVGVYESNRKLHLWNSECSKSRLKIDSDSTYTFIDCDWNRFDTIVGYCFIKGQTLLLKNFRNKEMKLFYKKNSLYHNRTRLFFKLKDYERIME